METREARYVET